MLHLHYRDIRVICLLLLLREVKKEPEKFVGRSIDREDCIVHFEQCAIWNCWTVHEMAELAMSLRGIALKL